MYATDEINVFSIFILTLNILRIVNLIINSITLIIFQMKFYLGLLLVLSIALTSTGKTVINSKTTV